VEGLRTLNGEPLTGLECTLLTLASRKDFVALAGAGKSPFSRRAVNCAFSSLHSSRRGVCLHALPLPLWLEYYMANH